MLQLHFISIIIQALTFKQFSKILDFSSLISNMNLDQAQNQLKEPSEGESNVPKGARRMKSVQRRVEIVCRTFIATSFVHFAAIFGLVLIMTGRVKLLTIASGTHFETVYGIAWMMMHELGLNF